MGYRVFLIRLFNGQTKTPSNNLKIIQGGCLLYSTKKNEETDSVCHTFLNDSKFYHLLFRIDQSLAVEGQKEGVAGYE